MTDVEENFRKNGSFLKSEKTRNGVHSPLKIKIGHVMFGVLPEVKFFRTLNVK